MTTSPRTIALSAAASVVAAALLAGCGGKSSEPGQNVFIEPAGNPDAVYTVRDERRPLPADAYQLDVDPNEMQPLLELPELPEAEGFADAYQAVGQPTMMVFVNRTMEGAIVPTQRERVLQGQRRVILTDAAVDASRTRTEDRYLDRGDFGYRGRPRGPIDETRTQRNETFKTDGPARLEERTEVYRPAGDVDDFAAARIDYDALEISMADVLGRPRGVTLLSPKLVRSRLPAEELAALEAGAPNVLDTLAQRLGADVLVQVQAMPSIQVEGGQRLRIVAEALDTADGRSIGRAIADFPAPMSASRLEAVSRYLGRRLMLDMSRTWSVPQPAAPQLPQSLPQGEGLQFDTLPPATEPATQAE